MNREFSEDFKRFLVNTDWTLEQLVQHIKDEIGIKPEEQVRMKSLVNGKYFTKEEYSNQMNKYETFVEGGARIQIDDGAPPSACELILKVAEFKNMNYVLDIFTDANSTVKEAKELACKKY